ncbi:hypothetical protein GGX14DRAFT_576440 [Mycena pura]|uniref:Uncharacterized protein n=1 Tax=Mycena pura TaxID=153505 RepID=A0AAD6UTG7_9AGAR|nr:hypothetical protein GGX14DRAFT_576440 [Mycena pura]
MSQLGHCLCLAASSLLSCPSGLENSKPNVRALWLSSRDPWSDPKDAPLRRPGPPTSPTRPRHQTPHPPHAPPPCADFARATPTLTPAPRARTDFARDTNPKPRIHPAPPLNTHHARPLTCPRALAVPRHARHGFPCAPAPARDSSTSASACRTPATEAPAPAPHPRQKRQRPRHAACTPAPVGRTTARASLAPLAQPAAAAVHTRATQPCTPATTARASLAPRSRARPRHAACTPAPVGRTIARACRSHNCPRMSHNSRPQPCPRLAPHAVGIQPPACRPPSAALRSACPARLRLLATAPTPATAPGAPVPAPATARPPDGKSALHPHTHSAPLPPQRFPEVKCQLAFKMKVNDRIQIDVCYHVRHAQFRW